MKKLLSSKQIYNGKIIKVFLEEVEYNELKLTRELVRHNGGASVLAEKDGKFAFVRQYRHPFGKELFELPAGTRDGDEDRKQTAIRELQEECGLMAKNIIHISDFAVSPGYTDEVLSIFYANDFDEVSQSFDDDEVLTVVWIDKNKCFEMAENGEIIDGKTLFALYWYANKFGKN